MGLLLANLSKFILARALIGLYAQVWTNQSRGKSQSVKCTNPKLEDTSLITQHDLILDISLYNGQAWSFRLSRVYKPIMFSFWNSIPQTPLIKAGCSLNLVLSNGTLILFSTTKEFCMWLFHWWALPIAIPDMQKNTFTEVSSRRYQYFIHFCCKFLQWQYFTHSHPKQLHENIITLWRNTASLKWNNTLTKCE